MTIIQSPGIGKQYITATPQPKKGDYEEFVLNVKGPDLNTDFNVPLTITGTALAIWGTQNSIQAAETLGAAIFSQRGTASLPPSEGYWFDSYNSGNSVKETVDLIANKTTKFYIKNHFDALAVSGLGYDINLKIQNVNSSFTQKFKIPLFKSLEDVAEESRKVNDLNIPAKDNANYLYKVSILSSIIDHLAVKPEMEDEHLCTICNQRHSKSEGTIQGFKRWLLQNFTKEISERLTLTFQMIKKLRNQYPIHDHYVTANKVRKLKKAIEEANLYFDIIDHDYENNSIKVSNKFSEALDQIKNDLSL